MTKRTLKITLAFILLLLALCCALIACITANNHASCRLHEALGFKKVSHFERVGYKLGQYLDVVDYELLL